MAAGHGPNETNPGIAPKSLLWLFAYLWFPWIGLLFPPATRNRKIALLIWGVLLSVQIVNTHLEIFGGTKRFKAFRNHLNEYLRTPTRAPANLGEPVIEGKIITVTIRTAGHSYGIDPLFLNLPSNLRANSPEEVGTIVWLSWDKDLLWRTQGGIEGYQYVCRVEVINKVSSRLLASKVFRGSLPDSFVLKSALIDRYGDPVNAVEISKYLIGLPRK